jgi:hypothetical protein
MEGDAVRGAECELMYIRKILHLGQLDPWKYLFLEFMRCIRQPYPLDISRPYVYISSLLSPRRVAP